MGAHEDAASAIAGLWDDGGAAVLDAAELPSDWLEVLAPIPDVLFLDARQALLDPRLLLGRLRDLFAQAGRGPQALILADALWQLRAEEDGPDAPDTLVARGRLGALLDRFVGPDEAHRPLHEAYEGLRRRTDDPDLRVATAAVDLARNAHRREDLPRAAHLLEHALQIRRVLTPRKIGLVAAQLAEVLQAVGEEERAAQVLQHAWEQLRGEKGEHDRLTLDRARTLGALWLSVDQPERAVPVLESLWRWVAEHGDIEEKAQVAYDLGRACDLSGHRDPGYRLVEQAIRWTRALVDEDGEPHPELPSRLATWARITEERGRRDDAEGFLMEAVEVERQLHGPDSPDVGIRQAAVGDIVYRQGRLDEAIGWMDAGLELLRGALGDTHDLTVVVAERLVELLIEKADAARDAGEVDLGWEYIYRARYLGLDILGPDHPAHQRLQTWSR